MGTLSDPIFKAQSNVSNLNNKPTPDMFFVAFISKNSKSLLSSEQYTLYGKYNITKIFHTIRRLSLTWYPRVMFAEKRLWKTG